MKGYKVWQGHKTFFFITDGSAMQSRMFVLGRFFQAILTFASTTKKLKVLTLVTNIRLAWKAFKGKYSSLFCPTKATRFPAKSNVCGWGQERTPKLSIRKVLYSGTLRTYGLTW
jgi:hypothetical protein